MRTIDVIGDAIGNTFRSKTRPTLTMIAIFIGAFTLTITTGLGTGINQYIATTVATIGAKDVMTVTHKPAEAAGSGPQEYVPDQVVSSGNRPPGAPGANTAIDPISPDDLTAIAAIDGVLSVEPLKRVQVDYVQRDGGTKYQIGVGSFIPGMQVVLAAGAQPDPAAAQRQVALPQEFLPVLGFADAEAAIGQDIAFGLRDHNGDAQTVRATVVGVSQQSLIGAGSSATPNSALVDALYTAQQIGVPAAEADVFSSAIVRFDPAASPEQVQALKDSLSEAGFSATTIQDMLGTFTSVINGIVLVLNAFAIIALLAAAFGIVNTLLMSVQELTREIGLMKAMGMGSGKVFGLFSFEAVFIGFLGSAIGVAIGVVVGSIASRVIGRRLLPDLSGLNLVAFDPVSIVLIILLVMAIAFVAGTLPAARAARQDPIESLRYE